MTKLRVHSLSMSVDGYVAGPNQSLETPLGVGGEQVHDWIFETAFGMKMLGRPAPADLPTDTFDDRVLEAGFENLGAWIMGRNMFGPVRGEWGDSDWRGWWGDNPPYHCDVYVLTHHAHDPIVMEGGTTFHFVTDGIHAALERATASAAGRDIRVGGGASTVQQYMREGLIDDLHIAIAPVLLGGGERLFDNLGDGLDRYQVAAMTPSMNCTHVHITKKA
jgi:dihydrofolate reductase